jgi:glycosyltransferase involved in cell wall biosynthesis
MNSRLTHTAQNEAESMIVYKQSHSFAHLRILFAINIPFPEGRANTRRIRSVARELAKQGHQVTILLPFARKPQLPTQVFEGINVERCLVPSTKTLFLNSKQHVKLTVQFVSRCRWLKELWGKSKRGEYDWLYLYQPGIDGLLAAKIARHFGHWICSEYVDLLSSAGYNSLVWRVIYWFQLFADRKVPSISDRILAISTVLEDTYHQRNLKIPVLLFPTLVDTSRFGTGDRDRFRQQLSLGERPVVAFTGSFVRTEGLQVLFRAMNSVIMKHPNVMLIIAGGSLVPGSDDIEQLIKVFGLQANALYLGMIPEDDIIDLLAGSDILVMPKLNDPVNHAGLSIKLAEYLASGKAVIASNVGDVGKYLVHEQDALLIPPGDRDALERALFRLLADPALCMKLGANARQAAIRYFDIKVNVARLVKALSKHT